MPARRWMVVFGGWTLFVWATRIGTALDQDDLDGWARAGRVGMAVGFTLVGLALLVVAGRHRGRPLGAAEVTTVRLAAAWTVVVWLVRGTQIALAGHDAAFVAVHVVLAVVSIGLAAVTVRATRVPDRHGTAGHRRAEVDVSP